MRRGAKVEWFEANIPYQNMRALKLHFPKHSEVDMKIGDLVKFTQFDGAMVRAEHIGVIVRIVDNSIKVEWNTGGYGWMHRRWLEKVE
jgi:hypothetical protein